MGCINTIHSQKMIPDNTKKQHRMHDIYIKFAGHLLVYIKTKVKQLIPT